MNGLKWSGPTDEELVESACFLAHKAGEMYARAQHYRRVEHAFHQDIQSRAKLTMRKAVKLACLASWPRATLWDIGVAFRDGKEFGAWRPGRY